MWVGEKVKRELRGLAVRARRKGKVNEGDDLVQEGVGGSRRRLRRTCRLRRGRNGRVGSGRSRIIRGRLVGKE